MYNNDYSIFELIFLCTVKQSDNKIKKRKKRKSDIIGKEDDLDCLLFLKHVIDSEHLLDYAISFIMSTCMYN